MKTKEYGGYLPLELPKVQEYFSDIPEKNKLRVNCGRTAFYCALMMSKAKKVYVPYLNCKNSVEPLFDAFKIITGGGQHIIIWMNH
ncbi:MAG: hypothetical protein IJ728_09045 [Selenomonadaceae bacterium]|nr:hypothetical protein [Selenomonadaceae bacterium]